MIIISTTTKHTISTEFLLSFWRGRFLYPIGAPLFTAFAIVFASQLHYPLPGASWLWPDKQILFDALILFSAYLVWQHSAKRDHISFSIWCCASRAESIFMPLWLSLASARISTAGLYQISSRTFLCRAT